MKFNLMLAVLLTAVCLNANAVTDEEQMDFTNALGDGNMVVVSDYISSKKININTPSFGLTPLQVAVNQNQVKVVKYLLQQGANINIQHPVTNMTALAAAVSDDNLTMAELLLSNKADTSIKMNGDVSVLRLSNDSGFKEMSALLIKNGAKDDGCSDEKCF